MPLISGRGFSWDPNSIAISMCKTCHTLNVKVTSHCRSGDYRQCARLIYRLLWRSVCFLIHFLINPIKPCNQNTVLITEFLGDGAHRELIRLPSNGLREWCIKFPQIKIYNARPMTAVLYDRRFHATINMWKFSSQVMEKKDQHRWSFFYQFVREGPHLKVAPPGVHTFHHSA